MTILSALPAAAKISGCALFDENDPNRGACVPASKRLPSPRLVENRRLCRPGGCTPSAASHRWRRSCQDTRCARPKSLASLRDGRRPRRCFRGLARSATLPPMPAESSRSWPIPRAAVNVPGGTPLPGDSRSTFTRGCVDSVSTLE
jgi:hypothetical protein